MRTILAFAAASALLVSSMAIPTVAAASNCANTGTVVGGVAGALLGNSIAKGGGKTGGTIIGGLGGAVAGHEIAKRNCGETRQTNNCRWRTYNSNGRSHRVQECMGRDGYWHRR